MSQSARILAALATCMSVLGATALRADADTQFSAHYLAKKQVVRIKWRGRIVPPMARQLDAAVRKWHGRAANGFELVLNSNGGKMREGRKVIRLLRRLKQSRPLKTAVYPGTVCGSSCIPIYLQGDERTAGEATLWLFHEVSKSDPRTGKLVALRPERTQDYFQAYFLPAGVPQTWLDEISRRIRGRDVWLTGAEVLGSGSNIITRKLRSSRIRRLH